MDNAFNRFVLRTPLLPFNVLEKITTKEQLLHFFQQPLMQEAIYLASPALYDELQKNRPDDKLVFSLMKYLQRAATRSTPFAFFASCAVVETGTGNGSDTFSFTQKRHTRPDMNYLCALAQHIAKDTMVREKLTYFPNTSIYRSGDKIRYTEYTFAGTMRRYQLTNVDQSNYLGSILQAAVSGKTIDALVPAITGEDVSEQEARDFINELIDAQLLVSNLDAPVTGDEFLEQLIRQLESIDDSRAEMYCNTLRQLHADLVTMDEMPMGTTTGKYREIGGYLEQLGVAFDPKFLFQADAFRETTFIAPEKIAQDMEQGLAVFSRLTASQELPQMKAFREAFIARYDSREVPLTEALDTENGLGYPYSDNRQHDLSPLIDGVIPEMPAEPFLKLQWTPVQDLLLHKITGAFASGSSVIHITDEDVAGLQPVSEPMADSFTCMCSVTGFDRASGEMQLLFHNAGDSSAINLLGRFCHSDKRLESLCREISAYEEAANPDVLLAEIVHLPESRIGNVLFRPVLRKYEIPFLAQSGVAEENRLGLQDLMLSVSNGRMVLRSVKHNRMIVPRMANAHNYSNQGLPVYHFLCDLQHHYSTAALGIDFDFFIRRFSFIPRIAYKNMVFAPASWQFKKNDLQPLFSLGDDELPAATEVWRQRYKIPRYQLLPDSDNELFIDWENSLSVRTFLDLVKNRDSVRLIEFLYDTSNPLLLHPDGFFTNQLIIAFKNTGKKIPLTARVAFNPQPDAGTGRDFFPGSGWLYFKIYTGIKTSDRVLTELLFPLVQLLKSENQVDLFFFIRYGDPRDHIRFRVRCTAGANRTDILQRFYACLAPACENKLIAQVQLDTYQRELERYGADTIERAEQVFETDSTLALRILSYLDGDYGDSLRWKIGLLIIDAYFKAFRLEAETIIAFTSTQAAAFEAEFNIGKNQRVQIDKSYREKRAAVEYVLKGEYMPDDECMPLYQLVHEYSLQLHKQAAAVYEIAGAERTFALLPSFIHMSVNRFFRSRQRFHELLVYVFLNKYHTSALARRKKAALTEKKAHV